MGTDLEREWPQPLRRVWQDYCTTDDPFRKVHRMVDCLEVHLKLMTVIAVQEALECEGSREQLQAELAGKLAVPSLGTWGHFLGRATTMLKAVGGARIPELVQYHKAGKTGMSRVDTGEKVYQGTKSVNGALGAFTTLRNHYAHGATPSVDQCRRDVEAFHPLLETLLNKAEFYGEYQLVPADPGSMKCGVRLPCGEVLLLWPLLLHDEGVSEDSTSDDKFFFFNDRKRNKPLHFLEYAWAMFLENDRPETEKAFQDRYCERTDRTSRDRADWVRADYLANFLGRTEETEQVCRMAQGLEEPGGLLVVKGGFGMGKGAMMSRMFARWGSDLAPSSPAEEQEAEVSMVSDQFDWPLRQGYHRWIYFFDRSKARKSDALVDNLKTYLSRECGLVAPSDSTEPIKAVLENFSATLAPLGHRLALFIDGLDEADRSLEEFLPLDVSKSRLWPFPGVTVVVSCRPIKRVTDHLPVVDGKIVKEFILPRMCPRDIRAMLYQGMSKYDESLTPPADPGEDSPYVRQVSKLSEGSPRYLECLVGLLRAHEIAPGDSKALPCDLYDMYSTTMEAILARLGVSSGIVGSKEIPANVVEAALKLLAVAREPLTEEQVSGLLAPYLELKEKFAKGWFGYIEARRVLEAATGDLLDRRDVWGQGVQYTFCHQSVRDFLAVREATEGGADKDRIADIERSVALQAAALFREDKAEGWEPEGTALYLLRHGLTHLLRCSGVNLPGLGKAGAFPMLEEAYGAEEMATFREKKGEENGEKEKVPRLWPRKAADGQFLHLPNELKGTKEVIPFVNHLLDGRELLTLQARAGLDGADMISDRLLLLRACLTDPGRHNGPVRTLLESTLEEIEKLEERVLVGSSWVTEAAAALASAAKVDSTVEVLPRTLYDAGRQKPELGESALGVRIALHAASDARDYDLLLQAASARKAVYFSQLASDELYLAASEDVEKGKWDALEKLFKTLSFPLSGLWRLAQSRRSLKPIFVTCGRLLINFPACKPVLDGLKSISQAAFRLLPRLDGFLFQRLILPVVVRLLYPFIREKWKDVTAHGEITMELEEVCTIREPEVPIMEEVMRLLLDELPAGNFEPPRPRDSVALLLDLGMVYHDDPLFQIRRAFHGALLYMLDRQRPEWLVSHYFEPYLLDLEAPLPAEDYPSRPALSEAVQQKRYAGLNEMVMRARTYVAMETDHPGDLLVLHERIARHMISHHFDTFCTDYNPVGRPSHQLPALALLEARLGEDEPLLRTRCIIAELLHGSLTGESGCGHTRFDAVAKCVYDLLMVGVIAPRPTFAAMGRLLDLGALNDGRSDGPDHEPNITTVCELIGLDDQPSTVHDKVGLRKVAARAAVVLGALETLYATQANTLFEKEGLTPAGRTRMRTWADWGDQKDRWPLDKRGKLTRDRIVQKYGEQARIGLFMNTIINATPTVREMATEILRQWIAYCREHLGDRSSIPEKDVRRLLRSVIGEVFSFLRERLEENPADKGQG